MTPKPMRRKYRIGVSGFANLNVVSNNAGPGIDIVGGHNVSVTNTFVGLNKAGTAAFGNTADGIVVENSSTGTTIGGATPDLGNFISGNGNNGVDVETGSTGTVIQANHVGSDVTGLIGVPNVQNGIQFNQTSGTMLSNSVLDNTQSGVLLFGGSGSVLRFNYIGDIATGTHGNLVDGVFLYGSNNNTISGNVISSNGQYGLTIQNGSRNTLVTANYVGLNGAGQPGRGNANGIAVFDSPGTTIGGVRRRGQRHRHEPAVRHRHPRDRLDRHPDRRQPRGHDPQRGERGAELQRDHPRRRARASSSGATSSRATPSTGSTSSGAGAM